MTEKLEGQEDESNIIGDYFLGRVTLDSYEEPITRRMVNFTGDRIDNLREGVKYVIHPTMIGYVIADGAKLLSRQFKRLEEYLGSLNGNGNRNSH